MFTFLRYVGVVPTLLGAALVLGGCESSGSLGVKPASSNMASASAEPMQLGDRAVLSMKGDRAAVFVAPMVGRGGRPAAGYYAPGTPHCNECEQAASTYFETGKLEENCPTCSARRSIITRPTLPH